MRTKVKPKRRPQCRSQFLPSDVKSAFRSLLSATLSDLDAESSEVNSMWESFKETLKDAGKSLPEAPRRVEAD